MRYRVAIIGSRGYPCVYSGYETFVREVAERLAAAGVEVTVYNHRGLFDRRPRTLNGIRLVYLPTLERKNLSQFVHSLQAAVHAALGRADVILAVNPANGPFGVLFRLFGKRSAINVDGLEWQRPKWKGLGAVYFSGAARIAARFYDVVVADCRAMADVYRRRFAVHPVTIAYGASLPGRVEASRIRRWDLKPRGYYLVVGRLVADNNADLLVREFLATPSRRKLVVVGDVPYRDAYARELKSRSGARVVFTGYVTDAHDLAALYRGCFAYLHGHEFGGTNPTLLNALAGGCAVCALDTVFSREVLDDGRFGLLFSKEEGGLGRVIRRLERSPRKVEALRRRSPARIAGPYTWDRVADQYLELFARMLAKGARRP
jgi:glycosyltransferase involved in cell wall biosynthesis